MRQIWSLIKFISSKLLYAWTMPKKALKQGVVSFTATTNALGHKALTAQKLLGIAPATTVTDETHTTDGTVLHDLTRGVTLLVPPNATKAGVGLHYKARFHANKLKTAKPVLAATLPLTASLPQTPRQALSRHVQEAQSRARILQHHSLTNWVLAQRALIHLSQMIEIIATGGRLQPTYGSGPLSSDNGALVDQAA